MMPESTQQAHIYNEAVKSNNIQGILNAITNDVFDVNFRDVTHDLDTPLMRLCHSSLADEDLGHILHAMHQKQPDVNLQDAVGRTLIMHASIALRHTIVDFSLALGCHMTVCDRTGKNAFHYGAESGSEEIMAAILKHPDSVSGLKVLDFKGYSAMDLARQRKAYSIVKMITQALSNGRGSNLKPANPRPLRPAFMKNAPLQQICNPNGDHAKPSHGVKPRLGRNASVDSSLSTSNSLEDSNLSQSDRWEDNEDNNVEESEEEDDEEEEEQDGDDAEILEDEGNNNDIVIQSNPDLLPVRRNRRPCTDELENFTASAPIGLIKPRPLPRLTNQNREIANDFKTNNINNNDPNQNHIDNNPNGSPPVSQNTRNDGLKQKNIFTIRPSATSPGRPRLPVMKESEKDSSLMENKPQMSKNIPQNTPRSKINLSLPFGSSNNDYTNATPRPLGPVVSPGRRTYANPNGRKVLGDVLNESNGPDEKRKGNFSLNETRNEESEKLPQNRKDRLDASSVNNLGPNVRPVPNKFAQGLNNSTLQRMSAPHRRDLEAILSPSPSHRRLLQKRHQPATGRNEATGNNGYTVRSKDDDDDSLFEEEIFLHSEGNSDTPRPKGASGGNRQKESRITARRSSLSLPDLRDMTGCLVSSLKGSPYPDINNGDDFDMIGKNDNKHGLYKDDDDYDDDDEYDDETEIDGESDDSLDGDLEEDVGNIHSHKSDGYNSKGNKKEMPLPSIQLSKDVKSKSPFPISRGLSAQ